MDLPEGILMAARAKRGRWWELTLPTGQYGYASNGDVAPGPKGRTLPKAALRGLTITEDSSWTTLAFATSAKVPYRISQHADPQRLSLVLHRTHMADEWTRYPTSDSLIDHFAWEQVGPELLRFDIFLNIGQQWGYRARYVGNQLHLGIRKPPVIGKDALFENLTIVLDPGHGGEHQGSLGATGMQEKDVNLDYALMLYEMLENRGANVHLTRTADTTLSLSRRMEMARELDAHLFIWLHNNAVGSARPPLEVQGASSFYTQLQALPFVRGAYPHLLALDLVPQGMVHRSYYITRQTDMVVYLVEGAFLSHPEDEMFLQKDENLKRLAEAVLKGLEDTLSELAE
jgi:N-acetylmuramoyl-L-alanine amidase